MKPRLRNLILTSPHFRDVSVDNLADAVKIVGEVQMNKTFSDDEIAKIAAFLASLTRGT